MSLSDLSFKLYTDSGLTTPFSGTISTTHNTSLSDNPQNFTLYFGSTDSTRKLQEATSPGTNNITLTPTDLIPGWLASTAHSVGDIVEPTSPNGKSYTAYSTNSDTKTGSSEPTWPTSIGSTVTDNNVVWKCLGPKHDTTELKLAATMGGLSSATPGAALSLGTEIDGGVSNAKVVWIQVNNAVTNVRNDSAHPELGVNINTVLETAI